MKQNSGKIFEQKVLSVIRYRGNVQLEYYKLSLVAAKIIKQSNDKDKIIIEAAPPYCTDLGNPKHTEIVFQSPINKLDLRIECKYRVKPSLIGEIIKELNYVADIPEKLYCLVLDDNIATKSILKLIETTVKEKNLINKVWFGSLSNFDIFLMNNCNNSN